MTSLHLVLITFPWWVYVVMFLLSAVLGVITDTLASWMESIYLTWWGFWALVLAWMVVLNGFATIVAAGVRQ